MRRILRRREMAADDWIHLGEDAADGAPLIVPLAELRKDPGRWWQWSGRLGVRLTPVDRVEELADELPRLDLVAVEFPTPVDGRGYSPACARIRCSCWRAAGLMPSSLPTARMRLPPAARCSATTSPISRGRPKLQFAANASSRHS